MAKLLIFCTLSFVLYNNAVEGRSLDQQERSIDKDQVVHEMISLVDLRRQLKSLKESSKQQTVATSVVDEQISSQNGASVSHIQLCSDAVHFLRTDSDTVDKRDMVINYVFNYCIKPSSPNYNILPFLNNLIDEQSTGMGGAFEGDDWLNWPGFGSETTTRSAETTVDYWQQLHDALFENSPKQNTESPPTTNWWHAFFYDQLDEVDESQTKTVTVTTTMTSPASSTDDNDLEAAFDIFWNMIEHNHHADVTTAHVTTTSASSTVTSELASTMPTTESPNIIGALNNFLDMFEDDQDTNEEEVHISNELHPGDLKLEKKKRLLQLLAKYIVDKRQEMRK